MKNLNHLPQSLENQIRGIAVEGMADAQYRSIYIETSHYNLIW